LAFKPGDVGLLNGSDEVPVELLQLGAVLFAVGHGTIPLGWANAPPVRSDGLAKAIGENPNSDTRICGPETQNGPVSRGTIWRPNEETARHQRQILFLSPVKVTLH
jgi:hypothetical protein